MSTTSQRIELSQARARNDEKTHFSNFGWTIAPSCADQEGYLYYRSNYQDIPEQNRTEAENLIAAAETRIAARR